MAGGPVVLDAATQAAVMKPRTYPTPHFHYFGGRRVWPVPLFKIWYPFMFTATALYFVDRMIINAMENDPYDKWNQQVAQVNADTARGKLKGQATEWYLKQRQALLGKSETPAVVETSVKSVEVAKPKTVVVEKVVVDPLALKAQEEASIQLAKDAKALAEAEQALKAAVAVRKSV